MVCHYNGDIISGQAAQEYISQQDDSRADTSYLLDFLFDSTKHVIDALHGEGLERLINHSCRHPNLKAKGRLLGDRLYLLVVAIAEIQPGDELLYDYGQRSYKGQNRPE